MTLGRSAGVAPKGLAALADPTPRLGIDLHENIPARGTAPVDISLHVGLLDAARIAGALASGIRTYEIRGTFTFSTAIGPLDVLFVHEGELS